MSDQSPHCMEPGRDQNGPLDLQTDTHIYSVVRHVTDCAYLGDCTALSMSFTQFLFKLVTCSTPHSLQLIVNMTRFLGMYSAP